MRKLILYKEELEGLRHMVSHIVVGVLGLVLLYPVVSLLGSYLTIRIMQLLGLL